MRKIVIDNEFSKFIIKHRLNDTIIARVCGVSRKAVIYWRRHPDSIKLKHVETISNNVGVDREYLSDILLGKADA